MSEPGPRLDLAPPDGAGRLRLRTLVLIRWVAAAGQGVTLLAVHLGLQFPLPFAAAVSAVFALALSNVILAMAFPGAARLPDRAGALVLGFDIVQLSLLLFLTGGVQNPFAMLLVAPVAIAAATLSGRSTILLAALALAAIALLVFLHLRLPWHEAGTELPAIYRYGMATALAVAVLFIAVYAWAMSESQRRMRDALAATQLALAREQRLSALGGLAAAVAHELGSPLGTIAVAARELARAVPKGSALAEDIALLESESRRCRDILARLAARPERQGGAPFERVPAHALVEAAAAHLARDRIAFAAGADDRSAEPVVPHAPEILHGLGALIENAVQYARARVAVDTRWRAASLTVRIVDDGPGFPADILSELGEPYLSGRRREGHLGLGVFIAKTLLERTGARLSFANRPGGGAEVAVSWPRPQIEAQETA